MEDSNRQDLPVKGHEAPLDLDGETPAHSTRTERKTSGEQELYSQDENIASHGDRAAQANHGPASPTAEADLVPALDFNGYVLYASSKPVPEELLREPSGTSIAPPSSVLDEENGRTYVVHETGRYFLPNDPAEQDRLDLQHKAFKLTLNGALYKAPVGSPKNVLDVATGTGIWAIQFAEEHPESNVIGTDLSLIQPLDVIPNVHFFKEDSEHSEWDYPTSFDYIHLRCVLSCFDNHRTVMRKAFENLHLGGWIELMDPDFYVQCTDGTLEGTHLERLFQTFRRAMAAIGKDLRVVRNYKQWLIETGFVDIVEEVIPSPGNPWPTDPRFKEIGQWSMTNLCKGLRGMCWKILRTDGMEPGEIEDMIRLTLIDIQDTRIHYYWPRYVVYGRKPYAKEPEAAA